MNKNLTIISIIALILILSGFFAIRLLGSPAELWSLLQKTITRAPEQTTVPEEAPLPNRFFPTGDPRVIVPPAPIDIPDGTDGEPLPIPQLDNRFRQISSQPVVNVVQVGDGATSQIIYLDKATGHLYSVGEMGLAKRLSNTTIPKVLELVAGQSGEQLRLIARYLKDGRLQNFSGTLRTQTKTEVETETEIETEEPGEVEGILLTSTMSQVAVSPQQDKIFYLNQSGDGTTGILANFDDTDRQTIFTHPLTEWQLDWPSNSTVAITTKPSSQLPGLLYVVDLQTKNLRRLIGEVPGLSAKVSPDGSKVLYSGSSSATGPFIALYDIKQDLIDRLPNRTLADKCTWSKDNITIYCGIPKTLPANDYPEDWYSGEVSFSDNLWKINTQTGSGEIIFNPELSGSGEIDAVNLTPDKTEGALYLINKRDATLWELDLQSTF